MKLPAPRDLLAVWTEFKAGRASRETMECAVHSAYDELVRNVVMSCVDCKKAITHDSWGRYFGPYRDSAMGSFEYHCGCDGTEERLLLVGKGGDGTRHDP